MRSNLHYINEFLNDRDTHISDKKRAIVVNWPKYFIKGKFVVCKQLKKHAIFMSLSDTPKFYGVSGISSSFAEQIQIKMPFVIETTIIQFKNSIIYDSLIAVINIESGESYAYLASSDYHNTPSNYSLINQLNPKLPKHKKSILDIGLTSTKRIGIQLFWLTPPMNFEFLYRLY
jgi:hypothetical protein